MQFDLVFDTLDFANIDYFDEMFHSLYNISKIIQNYINMVIF